MFRALVAKEVAETVLDLRFVITTLLCLVLIPLGMYLSRKDYERRLASYQTEHEIYRQRHGTPPFSPDPHEEVQGFRPPSPLSVFASGLDPFVPDKVITSHLGLFRAVKEPGADNPQSLLFGKADFLFNVMFIVSLAALIFTFDAISGEKDKGTLRLIITNPIPRARILLSKIAGKYVAVLIPFVVSVPVALLVLEASPNVSTGSSQVWPAFLIILAATLLFILGMVSLGICISAFTEHSMGSIVLLFFVWVIFVLGVPKVSPVIAEIIYPVEAGNVISFKKRIVREDIEKEFEQTRKRTIDPKRDMERDRVYEIWSAEAKEMEARVRNAGREPSMADAWGVAEKFNKRLWEIDAKYQPQIDLLVGECDRRIASELKKIDQHYRNKRNVQFSIAMNLARISPVCSYAYIVSGISGTGVTEPENFVKNAQRFQDQMEQAFYDNTPLWSRYRWWFGKRQWGEGYDPSDPPPFPDMRYRYPGLTEALQIHWPDMLLLGVFDVLFFSLAFVRFGKYDVR